MPRNPLPQMCGIAVCAIVVLGMDAPVGYCTFFGVIFGALAQYGMSLSVAQQAQR